MTGPVAGGGAAGHFAFDPDELRSIVDEWADLVLASEAAITAASSMTNVQGPGDEGASASLAEAANRSGSMLAESMTLEAEYCRAQWERFKTALDQYLGVDDASAQVISRQLPNGGASGQSSGAF